ncbi:MULTISPECIES: ribonuclease G [Ectothiorhodospira]|uniref:Ribonuclease G n=1 Tax=Ectothiorhodospira haloalkaliphila TaxID=421628 RepID=W8KKN6_9GAMM|nr:MULTISPECIES: ribonuclease G [Ectothiorhodospira]TVQ74064.1 MAG: ribonuclease G [Chromatiaceae bacterium]AHK79693.1 ribonuclease G [Ectothiorhodospira haloalkaliphila]ANB02409.1 ribonuclease G [Ectothiorhodospira sp. BSL-9]MCG5495726.1 ribonuclease G [Ectothiorhodospira variabilis]MCG5498662.1 ribonuclease G [Ectothiorhodospira variabilis]
MMGTEILMNVTPQETRVALVENGVLMELNMERARRRGLVGNIYKGRVSRVLPGMDAAFVDIGLERAAFLHASDVAPVEREELPREETERNEPIQRLLREGQDILVQVIKDPLGSKGARLTTYITVPSRYLVLMPGNTTIGISTRIEADTERARLKTTLEALQAEVQTSYGFIVRTAAEAAPVEALKNDVIFLEKLWQTIQQSARAAKAGSEVYADLPLTLRILRDMVGVDLEKIRIDSRETVQRVSEFAREYVPELVDRIEHYPGERPIFDLYNVEEEIQKALERKVELKSGGYLIFDQTEAMTTIDINTGAFVGHRNLEETIFKTNLEAAQAIARQLRLRNLGGIIIVDFIDMTQDEHKRQVLRSLEKAMEKDYAKSQICDVSPLGLVEMTRKRTRESLEHQLCEPCPTCSGRGYVKSAETVCYEMFREILREARQFDARELLVLASQAVVDLLLDEESASVAQLQEFIGIPIRFQVESLYTQEQFDVVLL